MKYKYRFQHITSGTVHVGKIVEDGTFVLGCGTEIPKPNFSLYKRVEDDAKPTCKHCILVRRRELGSTKICDDCKRIIKALIEAHEGELEVYESTLTGLFVEANQLRIYAHFFERMKKMVGVID